MNNVFKLISGLLTVGIFGVFSCLIYPLASEENQIMEIHECDSFEKRLNNIATKQELDDLVYLYLSSSLKKSQTVDWNCIDKSVGASATDAGVEMVTTSSSIVYRINFYSGFNLFNFAPGASTSMLTTIVEFIDGKYAVISRGGFKRWLKYELKQSKS